MPMPLTPTQHRARLTALQSELTTRMANAERPLVERQADAMDESIRISTHEMQAEELSKMARRLREIKYALKRLDGADWNICECCGEEIADKRLVAAPWATLCRDCQEAEEKAA
jgi:DnaK suppressor protein